MGWLDPWVGSGRVGSTITKVLRKNYATTLDPTRSPVHDRDALRSISGSEIGYDTIRCDTSKSIRIQLSSQDTCLTATGTHVPYGITQYYLPPGRGDIPAVTPAEAGTRLSDPGGMQGRVDLVGWLQPEMVYRPEDGHPSKL